MFRMRRYRVFLVFAIIAVGALYHFTSIGDLESAGAASVEGLKNFGQKIESSTPLPASEPDAKGVPGSELINAPIAAPSLADSGVGKPVPSVVQEPKAPAVPTPIDRPYLKDDPPNVDDKLNPVGRPKPPVKSTPTNRTTKAKTSPAEPIIDPQGGAGRMEILEATSTPKIHWSQLPEHFPVPTENIIQLPTGKAKVIPKIQHAFTAESADDKMAREEKLGIIKNAFTFSWAGYKKKAWMHDELSPISGKHRNPFCGWGATLVDALDTLWMMDLKDDFEEAVEAVKDIDFTTSARNDIPLFETVIRYLGGLIAAFDVSGGTHRVLLDKAVELADILMGAFDTPNRMPMTFYLWKPTFASQPHRAKTRVVLAELGSLSVEFTRLAQITKEPKYYDAIARITNEFEIWQNNTRMPGLWPVKVDASGCKKPDVSQIHSDLSMNEPVISKPIALPPDDPVAADSPKILDGGPAKVGANGFQTKSDNYLAYTGEAGEDTSKKPADPESVLSHKITGDALHSGKESDKDPSIPAAASSPSGAIPKREVPEEIGKEEVSTVASSTPECEPQGLASPPFTSTEDFTIGGQADSTYEYLPKEYMLLGGLEDKYRTMYEMAADSTTNNLLYRPMIPDEQRHVLNAGLLKVGDKKDSINLKPEGTHLTCFAGGMYAVGAKIFGREADMDIAKRLTDGCLWAYEATATGIMPETYLAIACPDPENCPWNETLWHEKLDPFGDIREQNRLSHQQVMLDDKKKNLLDKSVKVSHADPAKASPGAQGQPKIDSQWAEEKVEKLETPSSQNKVEASNFKTSKEKLESVDDPTSKERAEKAVSKPTEEEVEQPESEALDEAAEISMTKPIEGFAPPKEPLVKRQLGEVQGAPSTSAPAEPVKETIGTPTTGTGRTAKEPIIEKPTAEQHLDSSRPSAQDAEANESAIDKSTTEQHLDNFDNLGTKVHHVEEKYPQNTYPNGTFKHAAYTPPPIPTREEYVAARIKDERLPQGMTKVTGGRYLLRPEAIESVFIMYRATGDVYWREKGWEMFKAIEKHTIATYGASAIQDVTSEKPIGVDEMESFWLAETLKYFYLLFSDPSLVSLDDYVLNTEAHAFKRPE